MIFRVGDYVKGFDGGVGYIIDIDASPDIKHPWPIRVQYGDGSTGLYTEHELVIVTNKKQELWDLCQKFIKDNTITCAETIGQTDHVIENAYDFIEEICQIVGYNS